MQRPLFLITGMINTKEPVGFFSAFSGMARRVFTVPVAMSEAGLDPDELADAAIDASVTNAPDGSIRVEAKLP